MADDFERSKGCSGVPTVHAVDVAVQRIAGGEESIVQHGAVVPLRDAKVPGAPELLKEAALVCFVAMEFKAGLADACTLSSLRLTTSRAVIFSATKSTVLPSATAAAITLAIVCDLPVPGGPWMTRSRPFRTSCTASACELSQSTICNISAGGIWGSIDSSSEMPGEVLREAVREKAADKGLVRQQPVRRPCGGVEVAVHEEFGEREEAKNDIV